MVSNNLCNVRLLFSQDTQLPLLIAQNPLDIYGLLMYYTYISINYKAHGPHRPNPLSKDHLFFS